MKSIRVLGGVVAVLVMALASATTARAEHPCDSRTAEEVVKHGKAQVMADCFDATKPPASVVPAGATIKLTAHAKYDQKGAVMSASVSDVSGPHVENIAACVTAKVRAWDFRCGPGSVDVPFEWNR
jgi:hypothetical protein